jgi:hypothetical protein
VHTLCGVAGDELYRGHFVAGFRPLKGRANAHDRDNVVELTSDTRLMKTLSACIVNFRDF